MLDHNFENLDEMLKAYRKTNVIFAAFQLGVLDKISSQSVDIKKMADDLELSQNGLKRLLTALCALGIITKTESKYQLSGEFKKYLDPDSINYIGGLINHEIHLQKRWMQLSESIKSGIPVKKTSTPVKPEDTIRFINAMSNIGQRTAPIMLEKVKFMGNEKLLDIGGGPGKYMEKFCERYPQMQITLFDQPETISAAQKILSNHKNYKNMYFVEGDFFKDSLGKNYDVIFISNVIHIFGPAELRIIFDKCYDALKPSGRILVKDYFLNKDHTGPEFSSLFSIHMLLSTDNGRCYSEREMISLLEESQFVSGQITDLTESSKVFEGIKRL